MNALKPLYVLIATVIAFTPGREVGAAEKVLLNVSFDISRELFQQYNAHFEQYWREKTGEAVKVNQSHAGSSKQARAVIDGLAADVVTMNQPTDIDAIAEKGRVLPKDWRSKLPHNSSPFSSAIVFVVRKGNPKGIKDWDDLVKPGVSVIVPNPKTSGNGRYSYLSAFAYAQSRNGGDTNAAREFAKRLLKNVPVFDVGGRGATTTFVERKIGDVLLTFEAEALLTLKELGSGQVEIVTPSLSVEAEMPVAVVEKVSRKHGTEAVARAYLEHLYAEASQDLIARQFFRPRSELAAKKYEQQFGKLKLISVESAFGSWAEAQQKHFRDGGVVDQIQRENHLQ